MRTRLTRLTTLTAAIAACAAFALPAAASASTTVAPAGHTFSLNSQTVNVVKAGAPLGTMTCTMNGGTAAVPAAPSNQSAGAVTIPFTTRPTFSGCTNVYGIPFSIATSGNWQLKLERTAGGDKASVAVPNGGITPSGFFCASPASFVATTSPGPWTNGTTAPLVKSQANLGTLSVSLTGGANCSYLTIVMSSSFTVSDITNPNQVITVGS